MQNNHKPPLTKLSNALRFLAIDAIELAKSGHPGMPLGMADIATVLWREFLVHDPSDPNWPNRDRFVLSNGHGAMLLYGLLHLSGYDLSIEDLQKFRKLNSKTPGHPEFGITPGVEITTGPLGQGLAGAVGMAIAAKLLAKQFNLPEFTILQHKTYCFVGDGCLMEGISHEACSLAGTLGIGDLIVFWDDNGISIDGKIDSWCADNVAMRFRAYGWQVIENIDGHDHKSIRQAIISARNNSTQPSLLCCKTVIGYGSPNVAGSQSAHGEPLGEQEVALMRQHLSWNYEPFKLPEEIYSAWNAIKHGKEHNQQWQQSWQEYQTLKPDLANELQRRLNANLPTEFANTCATMLEEFNRQQEHIASRGSSKQVLNRLATIIPELLGGSADLSNSNQTKHNLSKPISREEFAGNYLYYGVREFAMAGIMNGIALYGGFIVYGGTFLVFSDYARNAIRMSALMKLPVIYVFTHDSIGLGEDGPTHQPIEHLTILRSTPNLSVWRPCDSVEVAVAWKQAIKNSFGPSCIVLSRQKLKQQQHCNYNLIETGGYVLLDVEDPVAIIIACGSEISIAVDAAIKLSDLGYAIRVVSMPNQKVFLQQSIEYQQQVLPSTVQARVAVEAGSSMSWYQFIAKGKVLGIDDFGHSAPYQQIYAECGITVDRVVQAVMEIL